MTSTPRTAAGRSIRLVALVTLVAACAGSPERSADTTASSSTSAPAVRNGTVDTQSGGEIRYACLGDGSPAILLEAGDDHAGTEQYSGSLIHRLAARTTVCTYDRPGTGWSVDLPDHRRTLEDVCEVQDQVLDALEIRPPYVLVGQAGAGNMVIGCARRHPDRLAGLVLIEADHEYAQQVRKEQEEEGWTWRGSPEHLDIVDIADELDALKMPVGQFPVLILSASHAENPRNIENQKYWLGLSSDSRQVVVEGGHDLRNPEVVTKEILALLDH